MHTSSSQQTLQKTRKKKNTCYILANIQKMISFSFVRKPIYLCNIKGNWFYLLQSKPKEIISVLSQNQKKSALSQSISRKISDILVKTKTNYFNSYLIIQCKISCIHETQITIYKFQKKTNIRKTNIIIIWKKFSKCFFS